MQAMTIGILYDRLGKKNSRRLNITYMDPRMIGRDPLVAAGFSHCGEVSPGAQSPRRARAAAGASDSTG